jgi:hypothetical protein
MDPAIFKLYGDFFGTDRANAILYGKYVHEEKAVRINLSLTNLATGNLIAETRYILLLAFIPKSVEINPSAKTVQNAAALSQLAPLTAMGRHSRFSSLQTGTPTSSSSHAAQ